MFHLHQILVIKKSFLAMRSEAKSVKEEIVRVDKYGNSFYYSLIDETDSRTKLRKLTTLTGIFDKCKQRSPKERVAYIPEIPKL